MEAFEGQDFRIGVRFFWGEKDEEGYFSLCVCVLGGGGGGGGGGGRKGMKIDGVSSSGESQTRSVTYGGENLPNIVERSAGPVEQACRKP